MAERTHPAAYDAPDFEQIARQLASARFPTVAIAEQLRQVWNARGEADIAKIQASVEYLIIIGKPKEPPNLPAQIRSLDR